MVNDPGTRTGRTDPDHPVVERGGPKAPRGIILAVIAAAVVVGAVIAILVSSQDPTAVDPTVEPGGDPQVEQSDAG